LCFHNGIVGKREITDFLGFSQRVKQSFTVSHLNAGAVKNIHDQIPENVQLYYFGTDPCSDIKASSLIKELERSSLKPPAVDHTKSIYGKV